MNFATCRWIVVVVCTMWLGLAATASRAANYGPQAPPVFINTWLVLGTFPNTGNNSGLDHPWISETSAMPQAGASAAGHTWRYFDDRLFSRNYDNYQDLFSYFHIERHESVAGVVAYAHVYLYVPQTQAAQLCLAADWSAKAWLNGHMITRFIDGSGKRQANVTNIQLQKGWNSLLLKIANTENGRFGFYARVCARNGGNLPDLIISSNGPDQGVLRITTQAMANLNLQPLGLTQPPTMPIGWRGWPYVGAHPNTGNAAFIPFKSAPLSAFFSGRRRRDNVLQASNFQFTAQSGTPPYTWLLGAGRLPPGLVLRANGTITGTIAPETRLGAYQFKVWVMDSAGKLASGNFSITVRPRPNKWYEEARLVSLMERTHYLPPGEILPYVKLLKRDGDQAVIVNAFNNGDLLFHYPSKFSKTSVHRDWVELWKKAIKKEHMRFGIYIGNITGMNNPQAPFSDNQAVLVLQEIVERFHPAAIWCDWSGLNTIAPDALFSAVRTLDPGLVMVVNGAIRGGNIGDWDEICFEGWGSWGSHAWEMWPTPIPWPIKNSPESWRLMVQPGWQPNNTNILSRWRQMLRIELSLIGSGFEADVDAIPQLGIAEKSPPPQLNAMPLVMNRRKMAAWVHPAGRPSLVPSFTWVNPGPLRPASWGYDTINLKRNMIYLHILKNPLGKTGLPSDRTMRVSPLTEKVKDVIWMNQNEPLKFSQPMTQTDHGLTIDIANVKPNPVDTVFRIDLAQPLARTSLSISKQVPTRNLAYRKPARLLTPDGAQELLPSSGSGYASNGVDGNLTTVAQAAGNWAWTYQVDLQRLCPIRRIVIVFGPQSFATEYNILLSVNGRHWRQVAHVINDHGGAHATSITPALTRYVRIQAVKPDGPGQSGRQMAIAELQVFAAGKSTP